MTVIPHTGSFSSVADPASDETAAFVEQQPAAAVETGATAALRWAQPHPVAVGAGAACSAGGFPGEQQELPGIGVLWPGALLVARALPSLVSDDDLFT